MSDQWFLKTFGQELGPVSFATLIELAHKGQLSPDDGVRRGVTGPWLKANAIAGLFTTDGPSESSEADPEASLTTPLASRNSSRKGTSARPPVHSGTREQPRETASPPESEDAAKWYVRIDGTKYGPINYDKLEALLHPPRLCRTCEVRHGERGSWRAVGSDERLSEIAEIRQHLPVAKVGSASEPPKPPTPANRRPAQPLRRKFDLTMKFQWLLEPVWENRVILGIVTLWISLNVGYLMATGWAHVEERRYLETYTKIWSEFERLRDTEATDSQWEEFKSRTDSQLEAIIEDLEKSVTRERTVKRHLLWAGRDYLRPIIQRAPARDTSSYSEERLQQHLEAARTELERLN